MKRIQICFGALGLVAGLSLSSCDPSSTSLRDLGSVSDDASGGVGQDISGDSPSLSSMPEAAVRARVRNESSARADVTLRFVRESKIVHLAFVRVMPETITTVTSPEAAEMLEVSGVDDRGEALEGATFVFGVDFDEDEPAEYRLLDDATVDPSPVEPAPIDPPSTSPRPSRITLIEPAGELTVVLGSTFTARWRDTPGSPAAVVTVFVQPIGSMSASARVPVGPAIGASLDGINDELQVVVQGLEPGVYRVLAVIDDGTRTATSTAPGRVRVVRDPENAAPTVKLRSPSGTVNLYNGELLTVSWDDSDPDDNATLMLELATSDPADAGAHVLAISPPIAEDPDGAAADSATLVVRGALPGLYNLLATIDDGRLIGTDRLPRAVRILPDRHNDPPQLTLLEPAMDMDVFLGRSLRIRWTDSDANDDARISLLLDPDLGNVPLDGDELLLVASLGEDADGSGDVITLGVAEDTPLGSYRLVGLISDGLTQLITRAPGTVRIVQPAGTPGQGNDNGDNGNDNVDDNQNDNGNDNGNGNANDNDNTNDGGGGRIIVIGLPPLAPPPPPPPPSPWTITPLDGVEEVVLAPHEPLTLLVDSTVVNRTDRPQSRIYLSNIAYGGNVRADATPDGFPPPPGEEPRTLSVPVRTDVVPKTAWPRKFDIEIETVVDGGVVTTLRSRPVWIVQPVEVVRAALLGDATCVSAESRAAPAAFAEIEWFGGGILEGGEQADVRFWLSGDGLAPSADGDALHRLIAEMPASPNVIRITTVDLTAALVDDPVLPQLIPGSYSIVSVIDPRGPTPIVSDSSSSAISVCEPVRASTAKQP